MNCKRCNNKLSVNLGYSLFQKYRCSKCKLKTNVDPRDNGLYHVYELDRYRVAVHYEKGIYKSYIWKKENKSELCDQANAIFDFQLSLDLTDNKIDNIFLLR
jgi:hypothetical protein